jgi:sigma-B regulation protein RsbU (phosphoserine phosphatase)
VAKEVMKKLRIPEYGGIGKLTPFQLNVLNKAGKEIPIQLSAALIYDRDGKEVASVGIFKDLRERLKMERDLREIQQALLPQGAPAVEGLDIAGTSIYCDETGGDYYDYLQVSEPGPGRLAVAVGDVTGHGISAALLMTTARAFLRSRAVHPGGAMQRSDPSLQKSSNTI